MTFIAIVLLFLLALYLAVAAALLSMWKGDIGGGWLRTLFAALSWPALLYVLARQWNWGRD